ncbi:glycosyltransferase family 2 protein [Isoptericola cucumis]|uniref:glycosyltransferase family 2 protein n=1 Tax=Isoptericola cucumis TaxID=1776856 RepID=UPI0032093D06
MPERERLVVVLSWHGRHDTLRCVDSLVAGSPATDVLVVDNGSDDGVLDAVTERWPHVATLQTGDNLGFAGGMDRGLAWGLERGYGLLTVLNNDTLVDPGALDRLAALATAGAVAASPRIVRLGAGPDGAGDGDLWFAGAVLDDVDGLPRHRSAAEAAAELAAGEPFGADLLTGCCVCATAATWRHVGGFDARYFLDFEDSDWSLRARQRGVRLVVDPGAVVRHRVSASFTGPASYLGTFYYARNALLLAGRWHASGVRRWGVLRHRVLPRPVRTWRDHGPREGLRTAVVVATALAAHVVGAHGRAPRALEALAATWAARARQRADRGAHGAATAAGEGRVESAPDRGENALEPLGAPSPPD